MKLSVIVCTKNRAQAIIPCLDSIAQSLAQAMPVDAEIVVIDSSDENTSTIREWANSSPFPVRLLLEPRKCLSAARNCALRAAQGDLLAWTDDDCRLSKDYVTDLLRYDAADTDLVLRGGRIELGDPTDLPLTIKSIPAVTRWSRSMNSARRDSLGNSLLGCNMAMRRIVAERIGPFDERLGAGALIPGGEDTDYIFRAYLAGIIIESVPDMAVIHDHGRKLISDGRKLFQNYSMGGGALYAKYIFRHPNLCRQFYWDMKNAVKEVISGKNTFMADFNFSHKDKVFYSTLGAIKFISALIKRPRQFQL